MPHSADHCRAQDVHCRLLAKGCDEGTAANPEMLAVAFEDEARLAEAKAPAVLRVP